MVGWCSMGIFNDPCSIPRLGEALNPRLLGLVVVWHRPHLHFEAFPGGLRRDLGLAGTSATGVDGGKGVAMDTYGNQGVKEVENHGKTMEQPFWNLSRERNLHSLTLYTVVRSSVTL